MENKKNNEMLKAATEVITTTSIAGATYLGASAAIGFGAGFCYGILNPGAESVPKKLLTGVTAAAATSAAVSTAVIVKKLGFFKKPNQVADINRQQVENYSK